MNYTILLPVLGTIANDRKQEGTPGTSAEKVRERLKHSGTRKAPGLV